MRREFRRWPRVLKVVYAIVLAVLVALPVVLWIGAKSSGVDPDEWPDGALPSIGDLVIDYATDDEPLEQFAFEAPLWDGDPLWTYAFEGRSVPVVVPVSDGVVVYMSRGLRLEIDGETVWERSWPDSLRNFVVGDTVLVWYKNADGWEWPARLTVEALDLATGETLWSDDAVSYARGFTDALFTSSCTGTGAVGGTCVLSSRHPATGAVQWSVDDIAASQVTDARPFEQAPAPDRLTVFTSEGGPGSLSELSPREFTLRDRWSGAVVGADHIRVNQEHEAFADGDLFLVWLDYDNDPTAGCEAEFTGYIAGAAEPTWEFTSSMRKSDDLASCGGHPMTFPVQDRLAVTDGDHPAVLDTASGAILWTAPEPGQAYGTDGSVLAALDWDEDDMVGYDLDSGEELWRSAFPIHHRWSTLVVGSTMWVYGEQTAFGRWSSNVYAVDLATGEVVRPQGKLREIRGDHLVTAVTLDEDDWVDRGERELAAWPLDLRG
jgi:hypothetical protein